MNRLRVVFTMNSLGYVVNEIQIIMNQVALSGTFGNLTVTGTVFDAQGNTNFCTKNLNTDSKLVC